MKFSDLDKKMRVFETVHDQCVVPGVFLVARIDGRSFTRLTKEVHKFEAPFDIRMRDLMVETTRHLMDCGFNTIYGYTQSDEISLLFHPEISIFYRKLRKFNSILAGEASAKFSLLLGDLGAFDCRISELPSTALVCDYFRWRNEDAHRNALGAHCYWLQRKQGRSVAEATSFSEGKSVAEKNESFSRMALISMTCRCGKSAGPGSIGKITKRKASIRIPAKKLTPLAVACESTMSFRCEMSIANLLKTY